MGQTRPDSNYSEMYGLWDAWHITIERADLEVYKQEQPLKQQVPRVPEEIGERDVGRKQREKDNETMLNL